MASVNKVILVGNLERDDALIAEIESEVSAFLQELEAEIEYLKRKAA